MSKTVFVVGATGTVGSRLVRRLAERGASVRAATRHPDAYDRPHEGVAAVRFDLTDASTYAPALGEASRVFMIAPSDTGTFAHLTSFIDAAQEAGAEHLVLMTAMGLEQAPDDVPLRQAELHLQEAGLDATILRPNWFNQNFLTYWRGMIEEGTIRLPAGDAKTSFVDVEDIAAAAAAALTEDGHGGQAYTLTGPEALSYHEAAAILSEASGRTVTYESIGDEEAHRILTENGLADDYAEMLVGLFQSVKAGHMASVAPGVEQATGHAPRTVKQFADAHADAWS